MPKSPQNFYITLQLIAKGLSEEKRCLSHKVVAFQRQVEKAGVNEYVAKNIVLNRKH